MREDKDDFLSTRRWRWRGFFKVFVPLKELSIIAARIGEKWGLNNMTLPFR